MAARVPLIFGTMTIGQASLGAVRTSDMATAQNLLDVFYGHGYKELDTARNYGNGTTEEYLSKLDLKDSTIDTKVYPNSPGDHKPAKLRETFLTSLKALGRQKVRVLYLHAPDRSVRFEETLEEMNNLYKEGLFEIFGLSNYAAWEVSSICEICKGRGWVMPGIYQAMYNALQRAIDVELVPCLRKYNIRLVVYNPLAGGLFSGKITSVDQLPDEGRFSGDSSGAKMYRERYVKETYINALKDIKTVGDKHGLRLTEIALRWCQHHSALTPKNGVILGASSAEQLEMNCTDSAKGPLPADVVEALDKGWTNVGPSAPLYWR
ncbi:Aldo/keto reductase [Dacryopinax primogenitus]|uniref:Aldo/keto reductase n=1 Tax=Dacryopinax primogenitus (strain DJM 731) TaxID=1858805 RepID=M5GAB4_DACPD|nr:Aldo/keto reductase [Dacryopinax primogenitus]EJU05759.1 Aldo/keto reductase [Dacryopinax primogenitus]